MLEPQGKIVSFDLIGFPPKSFMAFQLFIFRSVQGHTKWVTLPSQLLYYRHQRFCKWIVERTV